MGLTHLSLLAATAILVGLVLFHVRRARRRERVYVRPLEPLAYLDRILGRAAELGRPVFFLPGMASVNEASTLSAVSLLGSVARSALRYRVPLRVPCSDPVVLAIASDVLDEARLEEGRPAPADPPVVFLSSRPFAYAAGTVGLMTRERPAVIVHAGTFYAEALILAESGALCGALQVAASDSVTQAPFYVATCDRVLVGEELFAAGAVESGDPAQLGALKAQDAAKAILVLLIGIGLVGSALGLFDLAPILRGG